MKTETEQRLLVFEMRCYGRVLAVKWLDYRATEDVWIASQQKNTPIDIFRQQNLRLWTQWMMLKLL